MEYLGWNDSAGEGTRYFFSIPLDAPYLDIALRPVHRLFLYTSSGANTGLVCRGNTLCILPCFGVANFIRQIGTSRPGVAGLDTKRQNQYIEDKEIHCNIMKSDFFRVVKETVNDLYSDGGRAYSYLSQTYFYEEITEDNMRLYFRDAYPGNTPADYAFFRLKMGCNLFMRNILTYKAEITNTVNILKRTHKNIRPNHFLLLSEINEYIGRNTFFGGVDIGNVLRVGQLPLEECAEQFKTSVPNVEYILRKYRDRNEPVAFATLKDSPYIYTILDEVLDRLGGSGGLQQRGFDLFMRPPSPLQRRTSPSPRRISPLPAPIPTNPLPTPRRISPLPTPSSVRSIRRPTTVAIPQGVLTLPGGNVAISNSAIERELARRRVPTNPNP